MECPIRVHGLFSGGYVKTSDDHSKCTRETCAWWVEDRCPGEGHCIVKGKKAK